MATDLVKTCELCGIDFFCRSTRAKYCPECRAEMQKVDAINRYYSKKGIDKKRVPNIKPTPKASSRKRWVWTKKELKCPHDNCPFKSGNRPCLFYFEYKDGTTSCPGAKYVSKGG